MENTIEIGTERDQFGEWWGTTLNIPGVVTTFGANLRELRDRLMVAVSDNLAIAKEIEETADLGESLDLIFVANPAELMHGHTELSAQTIAEITGSSLSELEYKNGAVKLTYGQLFNLVAYLDANN
jgi:hypothetical protein